jgi:hypothetical protein
MSNAGCVFRYDVHAHAFTEYVGICSLVVVILARESCRIWWAPFAIAGVGLACLAAFLFLGFRAERVRPAEFLVLGDGYLCLPPRVVAGGLRLELSEISAVRIVRCINLPGLTSIYIHFAKQQAALRRNLFLDSLEYDTFVHLLTGRLGPRGITTKRYSTWFGIRWPNVQVSIQWILAVTTIVAAILGLLMSVRRCGGDVREAAVLVWGAYGLPTLLMFCGFRVGRCFGIGYFIGWMIEFPSVMAFRTMGWYPLHFLGFECDVSGRQFHSSHLSIGIGTFGTLFGLLAIFVDGQVRRFVARRSTRKLAG